MVFVIELLNVDHVGVSLILILYVSIILYNTIL